MNWVLDLVTSLPEFMAYVVPGYLFLSVYRYILFQDEHAAEKTAASLLNSIAISFVLKTLYDGLFTPFLRLFVAEMGTAYLIGILAVGVCSGYFSAKTVLSHRAQRVFQRLGVNRTIHENIWDDILVAGTWMRIWLKDSERSYYGQVKFIENYGKEPLVVLEYYQYLNDDASVLFDNTEDPKRTVLLNLAQFKRVEIVEG